MLIELLAAKIGISKAEVSYFLDLSPTTLCKDPEYLAMIKTLDAELLQDSLAVVRSEYDKILPSIRLSLQERYQINAEPMSGYTLGNWLIGFLTYPGNMAKLLEFHTHIPSQAITEMASVLIKSLDNMTVARQEWQRALGIFLLPLLAHESNI